MLHTDCSVSQSVISSNIGVDFWSPQILGACSVKEKGCLSNGMVQGKHQERTSNNPSTSAFRKGNLAQKKERNSETSVLIHDPFKTVAISQLSSVYCRQNAYSLNHFACAMFHSIPKKPWSSIQHNVSFGLQI